MILFGKLRGFSGRKQNASEIQDRAEGMLFAFVSTLDATQANKSKRRPEHRTI